MEKLIRFGVSIPEGLLKKFDKYLKEKKYGSRSEGIRDVMRNALVSEEWVDPNMEVMGTISIVYDHHTRELEEKMSVLQHQYYKNVISTTHVHIDHHNCFEVLLLRGDAGTIQEIGDLLTSSRGVKVGRVNLLSTGKNI